MHAKNETLFTHATSFVAKPVSLESQLSNQKGAKYEKWLIKLQVSPTLPQMSPQTVENRFLAVCLPHPRYNLTDPKTYHSILPWTLFREAHRPIPSLMKMRKNPPAKNPAAEKIPPCVICTLAILPIPCPWTVLPFMCQKVRMEKVRRPMRTQLSVIVAPETHLKCADKIRIFNEDYNRLRILQIRFPPWLYLPKRKDP